MRNVWLDLLEEPPFVVPSDREVISAHNENTKPEHRLQTELLPEPHIGDPAAPIVLLNLNPGFKPADLVNLSRPDRMEAMRRSLEHHPTDYPFYYLDPIFEGTGGDRWWSSKLKVPLQLADRKTVSNRLLCVEWLGYKSTRFKRLPSLLESQRYGFHLIRNALRRDSVIVIMRSRRRWLEAVPELEDHPKVFQLRSPQNVAVSPRNCPDGWPSIEERLA